MITAAGHTLPQEFNSFLAGPHGVQAFGTAFVILLLILVTSIPRR
jgi:hypothetical protein